MNKLDPWHSLSECRETYSQIFGHMTDVVTTHIGQYCPLFMYRGPVCCNQLYLRNLPNLSCTISYTTKGIPQVLEMRHCESQLGREAQVAGRKTVPFEYKENPYKATSMSLNEYVVDGTTILPRNCGRNRNDLEFRGHSSTPVRVTVLNCQGQITILGLKDRDVNISYDPYDTALVVRSYER